MKTIYIFIVTTILLTSCATTKVNTTAKSLEDSNNLIVETNKGKVKGGGGNTQIIFEGKNNIFEVIRENASYFNSQGRKDVIVIKGDGNHITLYNRGSVDLGGFSEDTLVFVGENERYVMLPDHQVKFTKKVEIDTVQMTTPKVVFIEENINPESETYNSDVSYYADEIKKGNQDAYYELAEIYNFGLNGVAQNFKQAIDLYEYGAVKNNIAAITRLADLWYNGHWEMKKNKTIGLYYYKRGAELGSEYCQEMVQKMMNN